MICRMSIQQREALKAFIRAETQKVVSGIPSEDLDKYRSEAEELFDDLFTDESERHQEKNSGGLGPERLY